MRHVAFRTLAPLARRRGKIGLGRLVDRAAHERANRYGARGKSRLRERIDDASRDSGLPGLDEDHRGIGRDRLDISDVDVRAHARTVWRHRLHVEPDTRESCRHITSWLYRDVDDEVAIERVWKVRFDGENAVGDRRAAFHSQLIQQL